ncbi:hypothetical protein NB693_22895 [Pantoea ananatis]|uniref:hypothetical protein n=1 Tax=Pantoea ananas TaxID=553 RepID=UPI00221E606E|nr:hypothetical protein [Pantoea ananatis]
MPETNELTWFLTCVAGKGILNRAHAYKAAVDKNRADGEDDDAGVTAGLFMYPVLMAADILLFKAQQVPVGRDHPASEHFVLPDRRAGGDAAGRAQDEQELRQHHSAVRPARGAEEAGVRHRHRFARARRAEGDRHADAGALRLSKDCIVGGTSVPTTEGVRRRSASLVAAA